jgi:hypothetical protein
MAKSDVPDNVANPKLYKLGRRPKENSKFGLQLMGLVTW